MIAPFGANEIEYVAFWIDDTVPLAVFEFLKRECTLIIQVNGQDDLQASFAPFGFPDVVLEERRITFWCHHPIKAGDEIRVLVVSDEDGPMPEHGGFELHSAIQVKGDVPSNDPLRRLLRHVMN